MILLFDVWHSFHFKWIENLLRPIQVQRRILKAALIDVVFGFLLWWLANQFERIAMITGREHTWWRCFLFHQIRNRFHFHKIIEHKIVLFVVMRLLYVFDRIALTLIRRYFQLKCIIVDSNAHFICLFFSKSLWTNGYLSEIYACDFFFGFCKLKQRTKCYEILRRSKLNGILRISNAIFVYCVTEHLSLFPFYCWIPKRNWTHTITASIRTYT